jgi:hypothetical protein
MRKLKKQLLLAFILFLFFFNTTIVFGDWDPGDDFKMHFPQLPDPLGWDIVFYPNSSWELADDWLCTETQHDSVKNLL